VRASPAVERRLAHQLVVSGRWSGGGSEQRRMRVEEAVLGDEDEGGERRGEPSYGARAARVVWVMADRGLRRRVRVGEGGCRGARLVGHASSVQLTSSLTLAHRIHQPHYSVLHTATPGHPALGVRVASSKHRLSVAKGGDIRMSEVNVSASAGASV
jgi:hypothetical protein